MSPLPPSRFRRIAKWTGLASCVVIAALWAVSLFWIAGISLSKSSVIIGDGVLELVYYDDSRWGWGKVYAEPMGGILSLSFAFPFVNEVPNLGLHSLNLPFWMLLTLAAIPTAILWHRDRRTVKPGCCQTCGYDLRASKKTCPECGAAIASGPSRG